MTVLVAEGLVRRYGGVAAVDGVDLTAMAGEVTAVIGPNGAGKTTLFGCLSGTESVDAGHVLLADHDVTALRPEARARLGLGRTFQRLAVFDTLTVADNLLVGAESRRPGSLLAGLIGLPARDTDNRARVEQVLGLLDLEEVRDEPAGRLSTGAQRLVELGRALCRDPKVLLLDEPASGLDTAETLRLQGVLRGLAADGIAVLLVEHDMGLVLAVADVVYAMASGRVLAVGTPDQVRIDPAVRAAYLDRAPA
ncbi:MAG: branched-chain amino acid transport system ATP-binding protein [Actinomycetota bacterium]|jgi:branched-chain amino acid transport system ATP-binding protein|nr:branched-chain amino acid transport system ATP-binding protein [Actinomycetota bacterium]